MFHEGATSKILVARKIHLCQLCQNDIVIGEKYIREVTPPWKTGFDADADDEGKLIGTFYKEVPKWLISKAHIKCVQLLDLE